MKIGIIGYGFVGNATHFHLKHHDVVIHDPPKGCDCLKIINDQCDAIFICLPTPTENGRQNIDAIYQTLKRLNGEEENEKYGFLNPIIIKSTVTPLNAMGLIEKFPGLNIIFSPEFLDQHNPFKKQNLHIVGCDNVFQFEEYKKIFDREPKRSFQITNPKTACMIKYMHNVFGALKVSLFNEFFLDCNELNIEYREALRILLDATDHISKNYTTIAADGKLGYGGACFPKDIIAYNNNHPNKILFGSIEENKKLRKEEMEELL